MVTFDLLDFEGAHLCRCKLPDEAPVPVVHVRACAHQKMRMHSRVGSWLCCVLVAELMALNARANRTRLCARNKDNNSLLVRIVDVVVHLAREHDGSQQQPLGIFWVELEERTHLLDTLKEHQANDHVAW